MIRTESARRRLGVGVWVALALMTIGWLATSGRTVPALGWVAVLAPFALLLPGLLAPTRNAFLLALLATIGYATLGLMDAIANPGNRALAAALAIASLITFFLLIPAVRTLPGPPRDPDEH
ncbi:MAG: hypothetical protein AAGF46_11295 [Pseudomonadota bacterium]